MPRSQRPPLSRSGTAPRTSTGTFQGKSGAATKPKRFGGKASRFDVRPDAQTESRSTARPDSRSASRLNSRNHSHAEPRSASRTPSRFGGAQRKRSDNASSAQSGTTSKRLSTGAGTSRTKSGFRPDNETTRRSGKTSRTSSSDKTYADKKFSEKSFSDKTPSFKKSVNKRNAERPTATRTRSVTGKKSRPDPKEFIAQPLRQSSAIVRLNKFLADSGICSRRQADELIEQCLVKVNGVVITEHGTRVHLSDLVTVRGEPVNAEKHLTYLVLNKPKDYITTTSDEKGRKTVMDLVPIHSRVYPVGRLDRHTTGVLLLTNDGDMAHRLMHPSYRVSRIYMAYLDKRLSAADGKRIATGVEITGEDDKTYVSGECNVLIDPNDPRSVLLELAEGKNREVRRIFETLGYEVEKLDRREYATITTRGLERGEYRHLTLQEIRTLEKLVGLETRYEQETTAAKPRTKERTKAHAEPSSEKQGIKRSPARSPKSAKKDANGGKSAPKRKTSTKASTEGTGKTTKPRISKRPSLKDLLER